VYVLIGGILSGLFSEDENEAIMFTILWPLVATIALLVVVWRLPYKFGNWLKYQYIKRKNKRSN